MSRYVYHFVQITVQRFPATSELMREDLKDFDLTDKGYSDSDVATYYSENAARNDKKLEDKHPRQIIWDLEPEYKLLQDLYGLAFHIIGGPFFNTYDDSPLAFDFREAGVENIICQGDLEIFKNHAIELMTEHNKTHLHQTDNVSFMAMYQWTGFEDAYNHEWDTECELVGVMTQDRLKKLAGTFIE